MDFWLSINAAFKPNWYKRLHYAKTRGCHAGERQSTAWVDSVSTRRFAPPALTRQMSRSTRTLPGVLDAGLVFAYPLQYRMKSHNAAFTEIHRIDESHQRWRFYE